MTSEQQKAVLGADSLRAFLDQFGSPSDPVISVFLEILMEELMNAKIIPLLSRSQQTGVQTDSYSTGGLDDTVPSHGPEEIKPSIRMGETDTENH
jgi:hypothetical protein